VTVAIAQECQILTFIPLPPTFSRMSMNVSIGTPLEEFVREKVVQGDYASSSEVVREGLRLLKRRDELWKAKVQAKIEEGMAQLRAGQAVPGPQAFAKLRTWQAKQKKALGS
jgi:antitoxin ParD1/3/4